jgi:uncharacterized repeat protein (TIGR03987 family)
MMPNQVLLSTILITLALVFYSIGVWSERFAGRLKSWHLIFFWGGFVFDTTGTGIMLEMAGGMTIDVHGLTGLIAFHKFSLVVWVIWLVPYFSGFFLSMGG